MTHVSNFISVCKRDGTYLIILDANDSSLDTMSHGISDEDPTKKEHVDTPDELDQKLTQLAEWIQHAKHFIVFTGQSISHVFSEELHRVRRCVGAGVSTSTG